MIKNIAVFVIFLLFIVACKFGDKMLLKYEDVQSFHVRELRSTPFVSLEVSGLAFHSSLAVERIETQIEANNMVVYVYLTPARNGLSGSFLYTVNVPEDISSVSFGPSKHLIWKRSGGIVEQSS